ncbi:MAG: hypothetical protein ACI81A_002255, partial [Paraglaciecola sp.]
YSDFYVIHFVNFNLLCGLSRPKAFGVAASKMRSNYSG